MDEEGVKVGLLIEAAQVHQQLVEALLEKLKEHTQGLDAVIRDQIHRGLVDELQAVHTESQRAVQALQGVKRAANIRVALWTVGITAIAASIALAVAWWILPSQAEISALRAERDQLQSNVTLLDERGGRGDFQRCGDEKRLCVRVDTKAGRFGQHADYYIVKGY